MTASTAVKVSVSMLVVCALVATRFSSSKVAPVRSRGLKGARSLQGFGGVTSSNSNGLTISNTAVKIGELGSTAPLATGSGTAVSTGTSTGTSKGFTTSPLGSAFSSGTSGGNSSATSKNVVDDSTPFATAGNSGSQATISSQGIGGGGAGGTGVFGPSLSAAVTAASQIVPAAVVVENNGNSKKGGNNNAAVPAAAVAPVFSFVPGLPTGGGGGGFAIGGGNTTASFVSPIAGTTPTMQVIDEAAGTVVGTGFGFGVGTGGGINVAGESAFGQGGGTAAGNGGVVFELDEAYSAQFDNSGFTTSNGSGGGYVGYNPVIPNAAFANFAGFP